jgi:ribonucleoside-diphosphate reductase alpha chain
MKASKAWHGVRQRWVEAAGDPDSLPARVFLPASWDDGSASAIAAMVPGARTVALPELADGWIGRAAQRADEAGLFAHASLATALHDLLIRRRGAPGTAVWSKPLATDSDMPRFVLNLPAFLEPGSGFDLSGFRQAAEIATVTLTLLRPKTRRLALGFADLDGLLAGLGLDYNSVAARDVAACLGAILRGRAECASARLSGITGLSVLPDVWASPPPHSLVPGLAEEAGQAFADAAALPSCGHESVAALSEADGVEAMLGVETIGLAPAFARTTEQGVLTRATRNLLAARGLSPEVALARLLRGEDAVPLASPDAHAAMHAALLPILPIPPLRRPKIGRSDNQRRTAPVSPAPAVAVELPTRRSGTMQKVAVGGHRVYLRTAEYPDGKLGEIGITLQKETPAFRALMDAFAGAVSLGLQHGVPLEQFVETFVGTRFGAAGAVEGDPSVSSATSIIDYVFRNLAFAHLDRRLPEPEENGAVQGGLLTEAAPTLPLDLPQEAPEARRKRLRVVS